MKRAVIPLLLFVFAGVCAWAQNTRLDGCLAAQNGQYVLRQGQQTRYVLRGPVDQLRSRVGQLVHVEGQAFPGANHIGQVNVTKIFTVQSTCMLMPAPGSSATAVVGKSGNEQAAVPVTTTGSVGKTTPGYQTEAGMAQELGKRRLPSTAASHPAAQRPGAPPDWEETGQNPHSADVMAEAAARAEVDPGAPQGTNPVAPQSAGEQSPPRMDAAGRQDRTVEIHNGACRPDTVSIRPGEAVQWVNFSLQTTHLASTGMQRASGVSGSSGFSALSGLVTLVC